MTNSARLADQKVQNLIRGALNPSEKSLIHGIIPKPIIEKLVNERNIILGQIGEKIGTHDNDYFKKYVHSVNATYSTQSRCTVDMSGRLTRFI